MAFRGTSTISTTSPTPRDRRRGLLWGSIFASALLLGEAIEPATFVAAALVIAAIAAGRRSS